MLAQAGLGRVVDNLDAVVELLLVDSFQAEFLSPPFFLQISCKRIDKKLNIRTTISLTLSHTSQPCTSVTFLLC